MTKTGVDDALHDGALIDELEQRATKEAPGAAESGRPSQASLLIALAEREQIDLFHDFEGTPYVSVSRGGHRETHPLKNKAIRVWLAAAFYREYGSAANAQAIADALAALSGKACFDGPTHQVYVRLAGHNGMIFLDLGNDAWQVVQVTSAGWSIIEAADAPVRFRRPKGMRPLPMPECGGSIDQLREFINLPPRGEGSNDDASILIVAWLLGALRPTGPYPILPLVGEHGTAKSTLARFLRGLIDPNAVPLRSEPRDETDLLIAATNSHVGAFDNLSRTSERFSDALCRMATGGGLSKRELYSDAEETLLDAQRPVLITSIEPVLTRGDAADRAMPVMLAPIPEEQRRTEKDVEARYEAARGAILGALLDAASLALKHEDTITIERLPRMADFARWVEAGSPAFGWKPGTFLAAFERNRTGADDVALDALPIGAALYGLMEQRKGETWEGTASELLRVLTDSTGDQTRGDRAWPKNGQVLSGQLTRLAPHLRRKGITVTPSRDAGGKRRILTIAQDTNKTAENASHASHASQPRNGAEKSVTQSKSSPSQTGASPSQSVTPPSQAQLENPRNGAEFGKERDAVTHVTHDAPSFLNGGIQPTLSPNWSSAKRVVIG